MVLKQSNWVLYYGLVWVPLSCVFLWIFVLRSKKAPLIARNTFLTLFTESGGITLLVMWMMREPNKYEFLCAGYHFTLSISLPIYFGGILCFLWRFYFLFNFHKATHEEVKKNDYSLIGKQTRIKKLKFSSFIFLNKKKASNQTKNEDLDLDIINHIEDPLDELDSSDKEKNNSSSTSSNESKKREKKNETDEDTSEKSNRKYSQNEESEKENKGKENDTDKEKPNKEEKEKEQEKKKENQNETETETENDDGNINYYIKHKSRTTNRSIVIICITLFCFHLLLAIITWYSSEDYRDKEYGCTLSNQSMAVFSVITFTYFFFIFYFGIKIRKYKDNFYLKLEIYASIILIVIIPIIFSYIKEYKFNVLDEEKLIEFQTILENPIPLEYFKKFCINDFCVENIMFWLSIREYINTEDEDKRLEMFDEYVDKFISNGARYQINISYTIKTEILNLPEENKGNIDVFNKAHKEIYNLMLRNTFIEFIGSAIWKEMIHTLKEDKQIQLINRYSTLV
ncbi:regulator of g protein signaling [Anaeramoeba flamelloides]|uniref:Regulator of g protein signaling n=1 Tax=Anaeramoeba flamelloides TaxID=1746091 RepID=A0ABQ8YGK4_9EUKA|nr:regulator of g protein signaling [Anaeramoeba flamelloides]